MTTEQAETVIKLLSQIEAILGAILAITGGMIGWQIGSIFVKRKDA